MHTSLALCYFNTSITMNMPLLFFWFVLTGTGFVSALPCMNTSFFTPFSIYDTNRRLLLTSLASNVTAHRGFYSASIGQPPNRVYAAGMCIPGTEPEICSTCIMSGSNALIQMCPNQKEASLWQSIRTLCMIRYSDSSFIGLLELEPRVTLFNSMDLKMNATEFTRVWKELTLRMVQAVSTNNDTTWSGGQYYAADVAALPDSQTLYGLMQCTPDLSNADCNICLQASVNNYQQLFLGQEGGIIIRLSCFFRIDLYPYFGAFHDIIATSPSTQPVSKPPPPPKTSLTNSANVTKTGSGKMSTGTIVAIVVAIVVIVIILGVLVWKFFWRRKPNQEICFDQSDIEIAHSLQFDFKTVEAATDKFSRSNKLGQGGFGEVYKGTLPNEKEIAVKRLSKTSAQGAQEFKNEVVVVAKLQHRNLVRLLGFCLQGEEKILVYEFVPNKSLDYFLFDPTKKGQLEWKTRYNIIEGVTRGILYLHQDSRLTIIHRDLKASNILLDADMNPKIADFGMARIFGMDQSGANTTRIVGTPGYMSPEYMINGLFSMKSDVYSFGVLVLEIICGRKNSSFHPTSDTMVDNLVTYAWKVWRDGSPSDLLDPTIAENYQSEEVTRCIHIALLCVQDDPIHRPNLSTIMLMLSSNTLDLPVPHRPGFFLPNRGNQERGSEGIESTKSMMWSSSQSINDVTITDLDPR
ncbi:PREDICTED: putative cysteine-rich receptor-like protein kinase 12 [Camelina sativa]|uniref:Cysteine-rich receptor-like protein kinase 12 n=1 Tax=Camelina sativa TaxID=90675 RepID=A0ABM0UL82_CAMSA|nr:PREDICTED: putative cysteine-rich receptor-like protein kinase 12 [Camelina sativa]